MPLQDLTSPPTAPSRSDDPDLFIERADDFVAWFGTFVSEMQTLTAQLEATAALIAVAPAYADTALKTIADSSLTPAADKLPYFSSGSAAALTTLTAFMRTLLDDTDAATARSTLGLGTMATQAASAVAITGGSVAGITDLAVADGGTGASSASAARSNLGAAASGGNSDITSLSGLTTALSVAQGGTGSTTAAAAIAALLSGAVTGSASAGTLNLGVFKITWKDISTTANGTASVTYHSAFSSWSRATCNGGAQDANAQDNNPFVVSGSESTTGCTVYSSRDGSDPCTVIAWGV